MCDYSLMHVQSRNAVVGDKLITRNFGTGTRGFSSVDDPYTAVCLLPGTELAFDFPAHVYGDQSGRKFSSVARFRQLNKEQLHSHHDALEFVDGSVVFLTFMLEGQRATVLQLPAPPRNKAEEQEQRRVETVA